MTRIVKGSQSVYRAIAVLRGVARYSHIGITATELGEQLDLTPATTHRLLQVLVSEDILMFDACSKRYRLGPELHLLGTVACDCAVRNHVYVHLDNLRKQTGETVILSLLSGADSLCLTRLDGDHAILGLTLQEGSRQPLGVDAGGLALLVGQPSRFVEKVLKTNANLYKNYSKVSPDEIKRRIADAKTRGFSYDDGYLDSDIRAIGTEIGSADAMPTAAVSIVATRSHMSPERRTELEQALQEEFVNLDWSVLEH